MTRWYRAYEGTVTDPKLGEVAMVAGCSRSVAIAAWHCILESAATVNEGGRFDSTPRRIAVILGEPLIVIETILSEMALLGMIAEESVTAWKRRQYESDTSTERSRKHRERAKAVDATPCNGDATLQQQHATPSENIDREHIQRTEEKNKRRAGARELDRPVGVDQQIWQDFKAHRKNQRSPITETALRGIEREALLAGLDLNDALKTCCERGWRGFKAEWVLPGKMADPGGRVSNAALQTMHNLREYLE